MSHSVELRGCNLSLEIQLCTTIQENPDRKISKSITVYMGRRQSFIITREFIGNWSRHTLRCQVCTVPFNRVRTIMYWTWIEVALMYQLFQFRSVRTVSN